MVPKSRKKKIDAEGVAVCGPHWCICRRCRASSPHFSNYSKPPGNFVAYCWKKQKSAIVTEPRYFPGRLRRCKIFKHAQLSLIGSYSPFPRRRWGAFSISFFSPKRGQPAFIKNKPITAHYCFPGHILKPLTQKKNLKQDYSLWVILLIMPSTWGHFVFFLIALKQLHAAFVSSNTTSAAIHCCFPKLIPQPCEILNAERNVASGPFWCIRRRCWASFSFPDYSMTTESFVTYFRKPQNSTFLSARRCSPGHLRSGKTIKRERRFRLPGHIPHFLVDDGALFPFLLSENKQPAFIKTRRNTTHPQVYPNTVFQDAF